MRDDTDSMQDRIGDFLCWLLHFLRTITTKEENFIWWDFFLSLSKIKLLKLFWDTILGKGRQLQIDSNFFSLRKLLQKVFWVTIAHSTCCHCCNFNWPNPLQNTARLNFHGQWRTTNFPDVGVGGDPKNGMKMKQRPQKVTLILSNKFWQYRGKKKKKKPRRFSGLWNLILLFFFWSGQLKCKYFGCWTFTVLFDHELLVFKSYYTRHWPFFPEFLVWNLFSVYCKTQCVQSSPYWLQTNHESVVNVEIISDIWRKVSLPI